MQAALLRRSASAKALALLRGHLLGTTFYPWLQHTRRSIRAQILREQVICRMQSQLLAESFAAFAEYVRASNKTRHELLVRATRRMTNQLRGAAFDGLRQYAVRPAHHRPS